MGNVNGHAKHDSKSDQHANIEQDSEKAGLLIFVIPLQDLEKDNVQNGSRRDGTQQDDDRTGVL